MPCRFGAPTHPRLGRFLLPPPDELGVGFFGLVRELQFLVSQATINSWVKHGLITRHAYNGHYGLYELPDSDLPQKHSSRWDRLTDRAAAHLQEAGQAKPSAQEERGVV